MEFLIKSLVLGFVQGLTEFLPVSSSGHLVLAKYFLNVSGPGVLMEVLLHVGTLVAVLVYFRSDILSLIKSFYAFCMVGAGLKSRRWRDEDLEVFERDKRLMTGIIVGTVPTGVIGFLGKDWFEGLFARVDLVGVALLVTAVVLLVGESLSARRKSEGAACPDPVGAFIIGVAQGIAIIPGISRSGITVATGLALGLKPEESARFSFLLSVPAIMGALALSLKDLGGVESVEIGGYIAGPVGAALVGYLAIGIFIMVARKARLRWFSLYCAILGVAVIIASLTGV